MPARPDRRVLESQLRRATNAAVAWTSISKAQIRDRGEPEPPDVDCEVYYRVEGGRVVEWALMQGGRHPIGHHPFGSHGDDPDNEWVHLATVTCTGAVTTH